MAENKIFVRITNQMVYDKLIEIEKHVMETNGKIKLTRWMSLSALGISTFIAGAMIVGRLG